MELADILHYLGVIKDIAGLIETDDPNLMSSLSGIMTTTDTHIATLSQVTPAQVAPVEPVGTATVDTAVQAVMAAAPSLLSRVL